jgi:large subunit ribosomal protein L24e
LDFEARRNVIERYDRNQVEQTIEAIKRIDQIRVRREARFYQKRMATAKKREKHMKMKELEEGIDLIKAPVTAENAMVKQKLRNKNKTAEMDLE